MTGHVPIPEELSRARYELEVFLLGGGFDLYEDGRFLSAVERGRCSAEPSYGKLILSCRGEGWARSWRIISCEITSEGARLQCSKQIGRVRSVVFMSREKTIAPGSGLRSEFATELVRLIEANFQGARVERARAGRDDRPRLHGRYTRVVIEEGGKTFAGLGVSGLEAQPTIDGALGAGLVWLKSLSGGKRLAKRTVRGLKLFAPRGRAGTLAARLMLVDAGAAPVSLYEVDDERGTVSPVSPFDQGDLADKMKSPRRRATWPREDDISPAMASRLRSIVELAPEVIESRKRGAWVELSINGLSFARASAKGERIDFGIETMRTLREPDRPELHRLVLDVAAHRRADATDKRHYLYRAHAERWLEAVLRKDVSVVDPGLDPRFAYSQVPTYRGELRTYIDLLGATQKGRLVVMELKVAEDAEAPLQGLDYWMRVEWHRLRGDFTRRGYFKGKPLSDEPPLLYLVAPLFRFHKTTGLVAKAISNRVPVYRVGINTDWRSGIRALLVERLN
ncbi:MAG TPA: hypothetical protein VNH22_00270 [Blastocatellia bacterium]|nr:hypothetical protein [Blastocatellia bacterium]